MAVCGGLPTEDRSHALRGNASTDAPRSLLGRRASRAASPRRAWGRSSTEALDFSPGPERP
ncbi:hypothetical protein F7R20_24955 [Pseudomonas brassicacearum subsp. brassicacearum]|nr:hypothetical protein F7R20_24955 [Pseudomonas brassicacearum subsp. brassicacearum]QEO81998.1 hypothetical protein ELZ14_28925 [Pseudomonas brassicacearum]